MRERENTINQYLIKLAANKNRTKCSRSIFDIECVCVFISVIREVEKSISSKRRNATTGKTEAGK